MKSLACVVLIFFGMASAFAQTYPAKPVTLVSSTGPGTGPDRIGRMIADRLSKDLGQTFLVDNQAGGGGVIAPRNVARAKPDGYVLLLGAMDTMITNPYTVKDLGYDPNRDFDLISLFYKEGSIAIAVHPSLPVRTLPELLALARKQPGGISYATTSVNYVMLFGQWVTKLGNVEMVNVPYKSPAQQFTDVLDGRVPVIMSSPPTMDAYVKAGRLRAVAVDGSQRYPLWPDVPLIAETFPGFRLSGVGILVGPKGMPSDVLRTLQHSMEKATTDKVFQQQLLEMGFMIDGPGSPESIRQLIRERAAYWQQVFSALNIKPQ